MKEPEIPIFGGLKPCAVLALEDNDVEVDEVVVVVESVVVEVEVAVAAVVVVVVVVETVDSGRTGSLAADTRLLMLRRTVSRLEARTRVLLRPRRVERERVVLMIAKCVGHSRNRHRPEYGFV